MIVLVIACVAANAVEVAAKLARARFVLDNAAEVGVRRNWIPYLAALEAAGVLGLAAGLLGVPFIGPAAAVGLVLFFIGAVGAHVRAWVFHNIAFPAVFLALAVAALAYFV